MKTLLDFIPILLFFAAYKLHDTFGISKDEAIYFATPVLMAATVAQMAIIYWIDKKLTTMHKITLGMILVFGGITLLLHDKRFIMWKPTVVYWMMGVGFLVTEVILKKRMLRQMMGGQLDVPEAIWTRVGWAWALFFVAMGFLNLYVAFVLYANDTDAWVTFKTWGTLALTLVFIVAQGLYLSRHALEPTGDAASGSRS